VVSTLWARAGGVAARPDNAYRLLHDQGKLALVFPEGTKGPSKSSRTATSFVALAAGASWRSPCEQGVPVIPIAVTGSEEAMPTLFRIPAISKALVSPTSP